MSVRLIMLKKSGTKKSSKKKPPAADALIAEDKIFDIKGFGIENAKLTLRERSFIFWYCTPGQDAFQSQKYAAQKAGVKKQADVVGYMLRRNAKVKPIIDKILNEKVRVDAEELYQKSLEARRVRAFFNVADFYDRHGEPKEISELTPVQLQAIDGIDFKGVKADKTVFQFADREKSLQAIETLFYKLNALSGGGNDFDEESMYEVVRERLAVRIVKRREKEAINASAQLVDAPIDAGEEEL